MRLKLNISTCPNDTYMFDALVHNRIDTEGLSFDLTLLDIEQLNQIAIDGGAEVSKVSYGVLPALVGKYKALNSGSALGRGNGPLLVSRHKIYPDELHDVKVVIPGLHTTANALMERLYPEAQQKSAHLFSEIAERVMSGEYDAGVLIHEGRFLYKKMGLQLIADLGEAWEKQIDLPLPLGAIVVSNEIDTEIQQKVERTVRRSVEYALKHPKASEGFVKQYAQEIDEAVIAQHIELFVNSYSIELGEEGRRAATELLNLREEELFL